MKFQVTGVAISRVTRRRCGKSFTDIVDTSKDPRFAGTEIPILVEKMYELDWDVTHPESHTEVKIIDVREVQ